MKWLFMSPLIWIYAIGPLLCAISICYKNLILEIIFWLGKYLFLESATTMSHMKLWLNKTYFWHRLCLTKPTPSTGFVEQNLCEVMLDKTYFWLRLCWTKPIPGIGYADQNLIWDLVVKICKARCFPSRKIISKIKWYSFDKMFLNLVVVNFCCLFFFFLCVCVCFFFPAL